MQRRTALHCMGGLVMIEWYLGISEGAQACIAGAVLLAVICIIWLIFDAVQESRHDEIHWRHGHGADRRKRMHK